MRGPSSTMTDEHNSRRRPAYSTLELRASVSSLFRNDESDADEGVERPHTPPPNWAAPYGSPASRGSTSLRAPSTPPRTPPRRGSPTPPNSPPPEKDFEGTPTPPDTPPGSPPPKPKATPSSTPGRVLPKRTSYRADPLPVEPPPVEPPKPKPEPKPVPRRREKRYDLPPPPVPQLPPQDGVLEKPRDMVAKGATPENARWRMTPQMANAAQQMGEAVSRKTRRESIRAERAGQQAALAPLATTAPTWPGLFAPATLAVAGPSRPPAPYVRAQVAADAPASAPLLLPAPVLAPAPAPGPAPTPTPSLAATLVLKTAPSPPVAAPKTTALVAAPESRIADIASPPSTAGVKRSRTDVLEGETSSSKRRRVELDSPSPLHADDNAPAGNSASTSSGVTAPTSLESYTATVTPEVARGTHDTAGVRALSSASTATKGPHRRRHRSSAAQPRDARGRFVSARNHATKALVEAGEDSV